MNKKEIEAFDRVIEEIKKPDSEEIKEKNIDEQVARAKHNSAIGILEEKKKNAKMKAQTKLEEAKQRDKKNLEKQVNALKKSHEDKVVDKVVKLEQKSSDISDIVQKMDKTIVKTQEEIQAEETEKEEAIRKAKRGIFTPKKDSIAHTTFNYGGQVFTQK